MIVKGQEEPSEGGGPEPKPPPTIELGEPGPEWVEIIEKGWPRTPQPEK